VRDIFNEQAMHLMKTKMPALPKVLGLDGVYFEHKECLMMTDLNKPCVMNLLDFFKEAKMVEELMKMQGRKRVRVIVIDMSQTLKRVAHLVFPKAVLVNDRYHIH
jgi:transposase